MGETKLYYDEMVSPVGSLLIISDGQRIVRIDYGLMADLETQLQKWGDRYFDHPVFVQDAKKVNHVKEQLQAYFQRKSQEFSFNFAFHGTPFQQKVWQALCDTIPYGVTKTYKDIAVTIGNPKAVRAVGGAVNKNPFSIVVPCHRVIGTNGKMVGYNGGLDKKEYLLQHEQVLLV
ncbi:methylated-DNA--protein-cysteine methyltransferase [Lentibacillus populi]|uniref:Methylated-DNA--protein-cysteine methyltransferase n=1 Tax=Lentibacillus populi TaxID=1827502 RepID=A0A9W5U1M7_9BACI|nr:methylated-DNA--[protein]-cysteine S-methyltransferase [Lentibacillus populi]MBT2217418.1 methylated-DNA--[protein]-cysteine S-methyltransferase [Virgibacillus dakarensis]GGB55811.1 methylated-DNA--protein-cysteine methyltransferase [Lentibacillus populi]